MTKTALIIGAQDYDPRDGLTPLSCARNDALALGRVLREQCGFGDVRVLAGEGIADSDGRPTKSAIRREINRLRESPKRIELLVVAFCAHGLTLPVGGADRYYLLPEDAHQHEPDSFLEFADLMRRLNEIPANDRAVIFDTCRNRPEAGRASGDNLLARDLSIELLTRPEDERKGTTAVLTACSLGERAYEMQDAGHGVFFHFLLQGMKGPAWTEQGTLSLNDAFGYAEREIAARKVFRQRPTFEQKGGGVILLGQREEPSASADAKAGPPRPNPAALADALDLAFWQSVQDSKVAAEFEAYLREFPTGRFVTLARQRLEALRPSVPLGQPTNQAPMREGWIRGRLVSIEEPRRQILNIIRLRVQKMHIDQGAQENRILEISREKIKHQKFLWKIIYLSFFSGISVSLIAALDLYFVEEISGKIYHVAFTLSRSAGIVFGIIVGYGFLFVRYWNVKLYLWFIFINQIGYLAAFLFFIEQPIFIANNSISVALLTGISSIIGAGIVYLGIYFTKQIQGTLRSLVYVIFIPSIVAIINFQLLDFLPNYISNSHKYDIIGNFLHGIFYWTFWQVAFGYGIAKSIVQKSNSQENQ